MGSISFVCPSFARARNALHARARSATASAGAHLARAVRTTSRTCAAFDPAPRASRAKRSTPPAPAPLSPPPRARLARCAALLAHLCRLRPRPARVSRDAQHSSRTCAAFAPAPRASRAMREARHRQGALVCHSRAPAFRARIGLAMTDPRQAYSQLLDERRADIALREKRHTSLGLSLIHI